MLRTLHPMIVHFPITLFYLTALFEGLYFAFHKDWLARAGYLLLTLSMVAGVAAGIAGAISESYVVSHISPASLHILSTHKNFAELSVFTFGIAWLWRTVLALRKSVPRAPAALLYYLVVLLGVALISYTGFLGGSLVYDHGVGVP